MSGRNPTASRGPRRGFGRLAAAAAALLLALAACVPSTPPTGLPAENAWRRELAARLEAVDSLRIEAAVTLIDRGAVFPGRMALVAEKDRLRVDMLDPFGRLVELVAVDGRRIMEYVPEGSGDRPDRPSPVSLLPLLGDIPPARELLALLTGIPPRAATGIPWRWEAPGEEESGPETPAGSAAGEPLLVVGRRGNRTVMTSLRLRSGDLPELVARYGEHQSLDGEPFPRFVTLTLGRYSVLELRIRSLERNVPIDDDLFDVDPAVAR